MPLDNRPIEPDAKLIRDEPVSTRVTRRTLVKGSGALAAVSVVTGAASGCTNVLTTATFPPTPTPVPTSEQYPVPPAPETPPDPGQLLFFTEEQARTLDALAATILPGDADDPGAREAGVVNYIDHVLARFPEGLAQPIYRQGPFAEPYDGDQPPGVTDDPEIIWVPRDLLPRYGYQTFLTPHELYRVGLDGAERLARSRFGAAMADLEPEQQEEVVRAMANGAAEEDEEYASVPFGAFFQTLRTHVIEGMFSDPAYGGNRDMAGWRLIGYPGAQRAYTTRDMKTPGIALRREPQPLAELPPFHPGVRLPAPGAEQVVLPVSGSDPWSGQTGHERMEEG